VFGPLALVLILVAAIKIKTRASGPNTSVSEADLVDAGVKLEQLRLDAERRTRISAEVLEAAFTYVQGAPPGYRTSAKVLGCDLSERDIRFGLERCYRTLARLAHTTGERIELVDRANSVRPRTLT